MYLNVKQRADHVATFRWIEVRLMETLATWVPTTPEMEVKVVFGAHIWDVAQHADILGKRTHELRLPLHDNLEPSRPYVDLLTDVMRTKETDKRVAAFYDCMLPALDRRFREYLGRVDSLLDGPTERVLERIMTDNARMVGESRSLREEVPAITLADRKWLDDLRGREAALRDIVVYRAAGATPVSVA